MVHPITVRTTLLVATFILVCCLPCRLSGEEVDNAAARAFNAAAALQNAGLHERAAKRWEEFASKYPDDERLGRANYYLGVCRLRLKKNHKRAEPKKSCASSRPISRIQA